MTDYDDLSKYGPVTRDSVRLMIYDAIQRIEERRDEQHQTNMRRFEAMDSKLNKIIGAVILVGGLAPLVAHYLPR